MEFGISQNISLFNIEAEEAVLGAILLDPAAIATALPLLPSEAFSLQAHKIIYQAAIALHKENKPTDLLHLVTHLNDKKRLTEVGGQSKLATLVERTVSGANIKQYIDLVIEKYHVRLQRGIGADLVAGRLSLEEAKKALDRISLTKASKEDRLRQELLNLSKETDTLAFKLKITEISRKTGMSRRDIEEEITRFATKKSERKPQLYMGSKFLTMEFGGGLKWLFPGILPALGVSLWGGDAGVGKTTLAFDCAVSLLNEEEFLGELPTKKGKVLFVCSDELPGYAQDKLTGRSAPHEDSWAALVHWDVSQWDILEKAVEQLQPDLILIDNFSSIHRESTFDENSSLAKMNVYRLESLSETHGCGIILLHHLSKNPDAKGVNRFRGASAIIAAVSTAAILEKSPNGETRIVSFPKMRGAEPNQYTVELDRMTGRYKVWSGGVEEEVKSLSQQLLDFFKASPLGRFELEEIKTVVQAEAQTLRKTLDRLIQKGLVVKRQSLQNFRNKVWGLAETVSHLIYPPPPEAEDCLTTETQLQQDVSSLDKSLDNTRQSLDTLKLSNDETQSQQNVESLDTLPEQIGGGQGSTELKWLLQLLSDMEGAGTARTVHPRFTSEEQVNKLYEKAVLKGEQCMDQLLATCSGYWDKLNVAVDVVYKLLNETELRPGQRVKVGSHYGHLSAKNCVGWFVTWDKLSSSEVKRVGEPPAGAIAPEQIQLA
jgi:hypothetical protein